MTTIEMQGPTRSWADWLFIVFQAFVPVALTAVIISLIMFRFDVLDRFETTAKEIRDTACEAVKESNDDLDAFLAKSLTPQSKPESVKFVHDLKIDHALTYEKCIVAAR